MSDVRVNPPSVRAYENTAQETFGSIRTTLETLVTEAVSIDYYGPNAVDFKNKCGELAAGLANALTQDMGKIAEAVKTSTTNIAYALGGPPVDIQFNGATISPPAVPAGDESVGVNRAALEGFKGTAKTRFTAVNEQFTNHLSALQATDWVGTAKDNAVNAVTGFTNGAKAKVEEANTNLNTFIDKQLEVLNRANQ